MSIYQRPKLRCFETSAANKAINAYRDAFEDAWKDILQVTVRATRQQEFALASLLNKTIERGEKLTDAEIHEFWNLEPINPDIDDLQKIY